MKTVKTLKTDLLLLATRGEEDSFLKWLTWT